MGFDLVLLELELEEQELVEPGRHVDEVDVHECSVGKLAFGLDLKLVLGLDLTLVGED